jgi:hypothetical protein
MTPKELIAEAKNQAEGGRSFSSHRTEPWFLDELASTIERLAGALEEVDRQLTNAQPHIASIADRYGPDAIAFIDPHIDMAIEAARRALSGEPTP